MIIKKIILKNETIFNRNLIELFEYLKKEIEKKDYRVISDFPNKTEIFESNNLLDFDFIKKDNSLSHDLRNNIKQPQLINDSNIGSKIFKDFYFKILDVDFINKYINLNKEDLILFDDLLLKNGIKFTIDGDILLATIFITRENS